MAWPTALVSGHVDTIFDLPTGARRTSASTPTSPTSWRPDRRAASSSPTTLGAAVAHAGEVGATDVSGIEDIGSLLFATFRDPTATS